MGSGNSSGANGFNTAPAAVLNAYEVFAALGSTMRVETVDSNGNTVGERDITVPPNAATTISSLYIAISAAAAAEWASAVGAYVTNTGAHTLYYNTNAAFTGAKVHPDANALRSWLADATVHKIGWVS